MISRRSFFRACVAPILATACARAAPASAETKTLVLRGADVTVNGVSFGPPRYIFIRQGTPAWDAWERLGKMPTVRVDGVAGWWKPALYPRPALKDLREDRPCFSEDACKGSDQRLSSMAATPDIESLQSARLTLEGSGPSEGLAR